MNEGLGKDAKLYFSATLLDGAANTPGTVAWTVMGNVRDLNQNLETGEADKTARDSNGWRQTLATLKDGSIEFEALWRKGDAAFTAFKDAWEGGTEIAVAAMSGDIATVDEEGLASNMTVTNFSRSEPLEDVMTVSITMKPSSQTEWYKVPAA